MPLFGNILKYCTSIMLRAEKQERIFVLLQRENVISARPFF